MPRCSSPHHHAAELLHVPSIRLAPVGAHALHELVALRELARVLPPDAWINNYTYQDFTMTVSGVSAGAAGTQKALEDSPVFKDAQLTSTITKDPTGKDRFSIKATVEKAQ